MLVPLAGAHSVWLFWDDDGAFRNWYVNLERPHVWHAGGCDTRDTLLDVVCDAPRLWRWKDEDELEVAVAVGAMTRDDANGVRAEGERIAAAIERWESPFADGWERWRADPTWQAPELPAGLGRMTRGGCASGTISAPMGHRKTRSVMSGHRGCPWGRFPERGLRGVRSAGTVPAVVTEAAMIRAEALEKRYGERSVLRGVSSRVDAGELHVVTGPNGSGKTTLAAPPRRARGAEPRDGRRGRSTARGIGYVGHEPLSTRDLTALENLDLYGRLYRVPERRERIGMLLERFGLWEARSRRVGSFSRGMTQRLALCRALLHEPELLVLDEPYSALDTDGAALLDEELAARRRRRATLVVATHEPERLAPLATGRLALGARVSAYLADVAALARKDLRLELRARDTLPAMVLFVLATLVVFHFALPSDASDDAAYGLLWVALVFTALLGLARAWAPEREAGALDGLVLAPSDRSAIWLGKTLATLAFLAVAELVALPAFALFFAPLDAPAVAGVAARVRRDLRRRARSSRRWPPPPGGARCSCRSCSSRSRSRSSSAAWARASSTDPGSYLAFLGLYDAVFAILSWAAFEYVVTE